MGIVLRNALLVEPASASVSPDQLRLSGDRIVARAPQVDAASGDEVVDCGGCVVLPGMVNAHTHLYSSLATGMPPPRESPREFLQILERVWWRLDRALDTRSLIASALVGALDALHCGTTTLFDHHASPNCIDGSLDLIEGALREVGLRGVLCYETTDRNGAEGRARGLAENKRYLDKRTAQGHARFAAMVGVHAAFTCEDDTLRGAAELAREYEVGMHLHVAEDAADDRLCREHFAKPLMERLDSSGALLSGSVLAHGTHLSREDVSRIVAAGGTLVHNPRSNANNAVGYARHTAEEPTSALGTDGIGSDMWAELQFAQLSASAAGATLPAGAIHMQANATRLASRVFGVRLGALDTDAAADLVVTDYQPATPLDGDNLAGHLLYAMGSRNVRHVFGRGQWLLRDRAAVLCDEARIRREATAVARDMWQRIETLD